MDEEHKIERQLASYGYQPQRQLASYGYGYHPQHRPAAAVTMKRSPVRQQLKLKVPQQLDSNALSTAHEQQVCLSSHAC